MGEPTTFIKLDRSFLEHWLNIQKPYDEAHAWIYILLKANYKEGKHKYKGTIQTVRRGELMTSETKLAEDWGWSRKRVHKFLDLLQSDRMITLKRTADGTGVFVENYAKFQDVGTAGVTGGVTTGVTAGVTGGVTGGVTHNKKYKKDKEREERKEDVLPVPSGEERVDEPTPPDVLAELAKCVRGMKI